MTEAALGVLLALLGLAVGSFLNVLIARVPDGRSIVRPGSACMACGTSISARDNIPIVSWLLLGGRCRACGAWIPVRYPAVEAANAVLWVVLGMWALASTARLALLPTVLVVSSAGLALAMIDLEHHRLPNAIVGWLVPITAVGLVVASLVDTGHWLSSLVGAGIWLLVIGGLWAVSGGRAMGMGDVKLAPVLGAVLGWLGVGSAVVGLFVAFLAGAIVGLVLMAVGRAGRQARIPFGPYLVLGFVVAVLMGEAVWGGYLGLAGA